MTNKVSMYIRPDTDVIKLRARIKSELNSSTNIKSDWTRHEIEQALTKIQTYLSDIKEIPKKGIIIFSSSTNIELIDPPIPVRSNIYRCGSDFYKDELSSLEDESKGEKIGMIIIDTNECTLAWFRGDTPIPLWYKEAHIMGKHKSGGQSFRRFERDREAQIHEFMVKIKEALISEFNNLKITKVLVAGPGHRKNKFIERYLPKKFSVIDKIDCEYTDDVYAPREVLRRFKEKGNINV